MGGYAERPPRPDRGQRRSEALHRSLLPGRVQDHPERRRRRPVPAGRADRPLEGRQAQPAVRRAARAPQGLLELLKAYRILRKTGCDCRLLVVGQGPLSREARRYVATRRLGGVEFLGRVSDDEKAQLFRTADVYVSPATGGESFGIVLLEAMAAGTPIVASDIHGYKGVVRRDREALLVEPRQPKQIAAAVARILRDDELRAEMSRAELARAQEFSWER
jgi:phosphatidylinositol alpha-mannosyltransferase